MTARFEGKVGIVTGSSRGIGRACAEQLASEGARLVLCAREAENLDPVARELGAVRVAGDANDPATPDRLGAAAIGHYGRIDLLINNASSSTQVIDVDGGAVLAPGEFHPPKQLHAQTH